jgi:hypothetical protein
LPAVMSILLISKTPESRDHEKNLSHVHDCRNCSLFAARQRQNRRQRRLNRRAHVVTLTARSAWQ